MLENKCPTCGRNLGTGYQCPVCGVYIPPKQDIKTPTKEQIKQILSVVPVEDGMYVIPQIITEWEKIRNQQ